MYDKNLMKDVLWNFVKSYRRRVIIRHRFFTITWLGGHLIGAFMISRYSGVVPLQSDSKIGSVVPGSMVECRWNRESILVFIVSLIVCPMLFNAFPISFKTECLVRRLLPCVAHVKETSSKSTLRKRRRK